MAEVAAVVVSIQLERAVIFNFWMKKIKRIHMDSGHPDRRNKDSSSNINQLSKGRIVLIA